MGVCCPLHTWIQTVLTHSCLNRSVLRLERELASTLKDRQCTARPLEQTVTQSVILLIKARKIAEAFPLILILFEGYRKHMKTSSFRISPLHGRMMSKVECGVNTTESSSNIGKLSRNSRIFMGRSVQWSYASNRTLLWGLSSKLHAFIDRIFNV
jgi:hypothetical protein